MVIGTYHDDDDDDVSQRTQRHLAAIKALTDSHNVLDVDVHMQVADGLVYVVNTLWVNAADIILCKAGMCKMTSRLPCFVSEI